MATKVVSGTGIQANRRYDDLRGQPILYSTGEKSGTSRTKHIDIQHHFVREKVESGDVKLIYMSTGDMVADTLTKPLPGPKFGKFVTDMGLCA